MTETQLITQIPIEKQSESIKIEKNSKGYNWEIRIFIKDEQDKACLDRIEALNTELMKRFGSLTE